MSVYLDLVVILNFLVDYLLLLGTNRLSGFPAEGKRAAWAAALGAVYSGACLLPGFRFLGNTLWRLVSLGLMASLAFGWNVSALRRCGVFVLLSMALGGIALGLGDGRFGMLVAAALGVWLLCRVGFEGPIGREYVPVELWNGNVHMKVLALRDTGNTLKDPVTGEPVLILGADGAQRLCGLTEQQLRHPLETMLSDSGYRLIPYHAVGNPGGMLLAKKWERAKIGDRWGSTVVAFAPEVIGRGTCFQALTC